MCVYLLGVSLRYLSAGLSGSIKRMTGGADRVSVAKTPPCSWIPKPVSGSPLRMTSLVSTWKTCPPGPTELDAKDTAGGGGREGTHQRQTNSARKGLWETGRRLRGKDVRPQRWHGNGKGMSHLIRVYVSHAYVSDQSNLFTHTQTGWNSKKVACILKAQFTQITKH